MLDENGAAIIHVRETTNFHLNFYRQVSTDRPPLTSFESFKPPPFYTNCHALHQFVNFLHFQSRIPKLFS